MTQQEMEKELKELKAENATLVGRCNDLEQQLIALRKRVRQIEVDVYKDVEEPAQRG